MDLVETWYSSHNRHATPSRRMFPSVGASAYHCGPERAGELSVMWNLRQGCSIIFSERGFWFRFVVVFLRSVIRSLLVESGARRL